MIRNTYNVSTWVHVHFIYILCEKVGVNMY